MPVIAALDGERQFDAERLDQIRRPRPERDHDVAGVERAGGGIDPPIAIGAVQAARVAGKRQSAERGETRRISARHRQRIADAHRAGPMHGVTEYRRERRFERPRRIAIERHIGDAEARGELQFARLRRKRLVAAVKFQPTGMAEIFFRAGFGAQRLMLGDRARHQRPDDLRGLDQPLPAATRRGTPGAMAPLSAKTSDDNWLPARA